MGNVQQQMWYIHTIESLLSNSRDHSIDTNNMEEALHHDTKWKSWIPKSAYCMILLM